MMKAVVNKMHVLLLLTPLIWSTNAQSAFGRQRSLVSLFDGSGKAMKATISAKVDFSANTDANNLHKAIESTRTDEATIITTLTRLTNYERQEIILAYEKLFNKPLRDAVREKTSGNLRKLLDDLLLDTPYYLAKALYKAMKGLGTDENSLIEILTTLWNNEVVEVAKSYKQVLRDEGKKVNKHTLLDDIRSETGGTLRLALTILASGERDAIPKDIIIKNGSINATDDLYDRMKAVEDAKNLYNINNGKIGNDDDTLATIICKRNPFQLYYIDRIYTENYKRSLLDDIESKTFGNLRRVLASVLRYATDRPQLIAEWIRSTMKTLRTKDDTLARLLITRSEIDLGSVKEAFEKLYSGTLESHINSSTRNRERDIFVQLISETDRNH